MAQVQVGTNEDGSPLYVEVPDTTSANDGNAGEQTAQTNASANTPSSGSSWWDNLWSSVAGTGSDSNGTSDATGKPDYWTGNRSERDARSALAIGNGDETGAISETLKKVLGFGKDNKDNQLLAMALMGVANAQKNAAAKEAAETQNRYSVENREQNARIARDVIAANSASVTGIKPTTGIVQGALTRLNGARVFNNGKQIIQR